MREEGFECRQCGHCCMHLNDAFSICATDEDVRQWEAAGREDILAWVVPMALGDAVVYDLWINPRTGDDVSRCPWLKKVRGADRYVCRIHDMKPEHCQRYPLSRKHAMDTGCPGYEHEEPPLP